MFDRRIILFGAFAIGLIAIAVPLFTTDLADSTFGARRVAFLRDTLDYLRNTPGVKWWKVSGTAVFIGFEGHPVTRKRVVTEAAKAGHQAVGVRLRAHVFDAKISPQPATDAGAAGFICTVTYDDGKQVASTCP